MKCQRCDKEFIGLHHTQKYCGSDCRNKAKNLRRNPKRERHIRCLNPECGKEISSTWQSKQYCSHTCVKRHWYLRNVAKFKAASPKLRNCAECNRLFTPKINAGQFCSKACCSRYHKAKRPSKPILAKTCPSCSVTFHTSSLKKIYCTIRCSHKHHQSLRPKKIKTRRKEFGVRNCIVCDTPFTPLWDSPKKRSQTCSDRECRRLSDRGIIEMFNKHSTVKVHDVPQELIELKRAHIKLKRLIKQKQHNYDTRRITQ